MSKEAFVQEVLNDYRIAFESRQASLIGRKEVLTGKAKFGIFGDGKEIAQIAMAKVFQHGDWRLFPLHFFPVSDKSVACYQNLCKIIVLDRFRC